jgi:hypothetical protein
MADQSPQGSSTEQFAILKEIYTHVHSEMMDFRSAGLRATTIYATFVAGVLGWMLAERRATGSFVSLSLIGFAVTLYMWFYFIRVEMFFSDAAEVINKIEKLWGAFKENHFAPQGNQGNLEELWGLHERKTILFPKRWQYFGTPTWGEPIFLYTKILLGGMFVIFAVLILSLAPCIGPVIQSVLPFLLIPR